MAERSRYLKDIMGADERAVKKGRKRYTTCGAGEQAFNLRVDLKDGRKKRGFSWSQYTDYQWTDEGDSETLVILFGLRIVTVRGFHLDGLAREIDEGKLKTFEELMATEVRELQNSPDDDPVVTAVEFYPPFEDIIETLKGEDDEAGNAG